MYCMMRTKLGQGRVLEEHQTPTVQSDGASQQTEKHQSTTNIFYNLTFRFFFVFNVGGESDVRRVWSTAEYKYSRTHNTLICFLLTLFWKNKRSQTVCVCIVMTTETSLNRKKTADAVETKCIKSNRWVISREELSQQSHDFTATAVRFSSDSST